MNLSKRWTFTFEITRKRQRVDTRWEEIHPKIPETFVTLAGELTTREMINPSRVVKGRAVEIDSRHGPRYAVKDKIGPHGSRITRFPYGSTGFDVYGERMPENVLIDWCWHKRYSKQTRRGGQAWANWRMAHLFLCRAMAIGYAGNVVFVGEADDKMLFERRPGSRRGLVVLVQYEYSQGPPLPDQQGVSRFADYLDTLADWTTVSLDPRK